MDMWLPRWPAWCPQLGSASAYAFLVLRGLRGFEMVDRFQGVRVYLGFTALNSETMPDGL